MQIYAEGREEEIQRSQKLTCNEILKATGPPFCFVQTCTAPYDLLLKCTLLNFAIRLTFDGQLSAQTEGHKSSVNPFPITYDAGFSWWSRRDGLVIQCPNTSLADYSNNASHSIASIAQRVNRIHLCLFDVSSHHNACIVSKLLSLKKNY